LKIGPVLDNCFINEIYNCAEEKLRCRPSVEGSIGKRNCSLSRGNSVPLQRYLSVIKFITVSRRTLAVFYSEHFIFLSLFSLKVESFKYT
jgi:hypothetical protein